METHRLPLRRRVSVVRPDPDRYAHRRLSSLVVAIGAVVAVLASIALEGFGASSPVALAIGGALFVLWAILATTLADRHPGGRAPR